MTTNGREISQHKEIANQIWAICDLLRGPYKRNEYKKVILPLTVLKRFDHILAKSKEAVLAKFFEIKAKPQSYIEAELYKITGVNFYNLSRLNFDKLLDDPNNIAPNLASYINAFSSNIGKIMERFKFDDEIAKMNEKDLLYKVVQKFSRDIDLAPDKYDNAAMGLIFEHLIRISAEASNEEAGEHFTPREVIKLMVDLLLAPEDELKRIDGKVVKVYDPTCGTGGMLSVSDERLHELNNTVETHLFGQDWNDEAWALCRADTLIKGQNADNIKLGCTFRDDGFKTDKFDYMLANPPFGVSWKQQEKFINDEHDEKGMHGRFGAGTPRVNDGSLLFLQHMISKMMPYDADPIQRKTGSRIGIVFNGSPLFTGDAESGESNIRKWIIDDNDYLEAIVALPDQLFYNTGISTYIWILSNKKEEKRKKKIQLIDAREFWARMKKSLGNKRKFIGNGEEGSQNFIEIIAGIYDRFCYNEEMEITNGDGETKRIIVSKILDNDDFGYRKITVDRPLRLNFVASDERIEFLKTQSGFRKLVESNKKNAAERIKEEEQGAARQIAIIDFLRSFHQSNGGKKYMSRKDFLADLKIADKNSGIVLNSIELKAVIDALGERDEEAEICRNIKGEPEMDTELRDTENVPLKIDVDEYFKNEVLPHVPDALPLDHSKIKIGYEINFTKQFFVYNPPRPLEVIDAEIKEIEKELARLLGV